MNWFEILVIAGIFLNLFILSYILLGISDKLDEVNNRIHHANENIFAIGKKLEKRWNIY